MLERDLAGRVALLTGSTEGLGLRIAERFARRGASVVLNGRDEAKASRAVAALEAFGGSDNPPSFVLGDCGNYDSAVKVAWGAAEATGRIDILVSVGATGSVPPMPFAEMTGKQVSDSLTSRFFPRINPVHAALPFLRVRGGSVVLIGTDAARHPTVGESLVGAAGAGVILLTKALAREFTRWSIRVNCVAMTITSGTAAWNRVFAEDSMQSRLFAKALERFPSGRAPTAEEVARVAEFLAGDESAQVTGQTVSVNGGLSFGGW